MTFDIEITLNRWGLGRVALNKIQIGPLRLSWWPIADVRKHAISFEVNWKPRRERVSPNNRLVNAEFPMDGPNWCHECNAVCGNATGPKPGCQCDVCVSKSYKDCKRCGGSGVDPEPAEDPITGEPQPLECEDCRERNAEG